MIYDEIAATPEAKNTIKEVMKPFELNLANISRLPLGALSKITKFGSDLVELSVAKAKANEQIDLKDVQALLVKHLGPEAEKIDLVNFSKQSFCDLLGLLGLDDKTILHLLQGFGG